MELMLLVAVAAVVSIPAEVVVAVVVACEAAEADGSKEDDLTVAGLILLVVVIVAVVTAAVEDCGCEVEGERKGDPATPTISAMSSENSREGENGRDGLKLISKPSSVRGEWSGVRLCGLGRREGDDAEELCFVEADVVVFCKV